MSILSQDIFSTIETSVMCQTFLDDHNPTKLQHWQTGVIGNSTHPYPKFDKLTDPVIFRSDAWTCGNGLHSTLPIVIKGCIDFKKYNIPIISSDFHITFFPSSSTVKNLPPLKTTKRLLIDGNLNEINGADLTANTVEFCTVWVGNNPNISHTNFYCDNLKFSNELPRFVDCSGHVDLLEVNWLFAGTADERIKNWIVPGTYGVIPKKSIKNWKDLRAVVNLDKKYGAPLAIDLRKFLNLNTVEVDLGIEKLNFKYIRFTFYGVEFGFSKMDGKWELISAIKRR